MLGIFRDPWLEDREIRQREQRAKLLGGIGLIGALFTGAFLICSQLGETVAAVGVGASFSWRRLLPEPARVFCSLFLGCSWSVR